MQKVPTKLNQILFLLLLFSFEIYWFRLPDYFHWKLLLKVGLLYLCGIYSLSNLRGIAIYASDLWPLAMYVFFAFSSAIFSISKAYVFSQAILLMLLTGFMYITAKHIVEKDDNEFLLILSVFFTVVIFLSIVMSFVAPSRVITVEAGARRLRGLYGEPSALSMTCCLNILLVWCFFKKHLKYLITLLSLYCLYLTGVRTGAIGLLFVMIFFIFFAKIPSQIPRLVFGIISILLIVSVYSIFPNVLETENRYIRVESLSTFSGRTDVWKLAIKKTLSAPLGTGYCLGGSLLVGSHELFGSKRPKTLFQRKGSGFSTLGHSKGAKSTLHNGYVQALADTGWIGFLCYVIVFFKGIKFAISGVSTKNMAIFSYIIFFITIVNLSESTVMSPTYSIATLYWLSWFVLMIHSRKIQSRL